MRDIYTADMVSTLPECLMYDDRIVAIAQVIAEQLRKTAGLIKCVLIYSRIDELDEDLVDVLAYDLHVDWYDPDASLEIKRELVKNSIKVHIRLGTPWAVMNVINEYFGYGEMREWWEYGGEPHHFKILSTNPRITSDELDRFMNILNIVKRASSWLDDILITLTGESHVYVGMAIGISTDMAFNMTQYQGRDVVEYVNGKKGHVVLNTDDIGEGDRNLYYTDERATENFNANFAQSSYTRLIDGEQIVNSENEILVKPEVI